jgi:nitronate monooxygenase
MASSLTCDYPWTNPPFIACAPMRLISLAPLAVAVSQAGGLGFIGAGSELSNLSKQLRHAQSILRDSPIESTTPGILAVGVGFINWGADLDAAVDVLTTYVPAAVWLFAPRENADLEQWSRRIREATIGKTKIWVQIGTVGDALEVARLCRPDVLVVQGADAGGHGLERGASIVSLLPEVHDVLHATGMRGISLVAAGGIVEGRGVAAALVLGAEGVAMGTRFLASEEAQVAKGYQNDVIRVGDGGVSTVRSKVYDSLRGTTGWPDHYGGRGIINESFMDAKNGEVTDSNRRNYEEALKKGDQGWGKSGRLTAYAGTGVGLITKVLPAREIIEEIRRDVKEVQARIASSGSML